MALRDVEGAWQDPEDWTLGFGFNMSINKKATVKKYQPCLKIEDRLLAPEQLKLPFLEERGGQREQPLPRPHILLPYPAESLALSLLLCVPFWTSLHRDLTADVHSSPEPTLALVPMLSLPQGWKIRENYSISHTTNSASTAVCIQMASLCS